VFDAEASGLPAPACFLFDRQRQLVAKLPAGSAVEDAPSIVRRNVRPLAESPRPSVVSGVAYLPILARPRLLIVGGGHIGKAVAELASGLEFDIWVLDDRPEFVDQRRFPQAERRLCGDMDAVLPGVDITAETYCLIVTRGHQHDEDALCQLAGRGARYVGMIGSQRKIKLVFENLLRRGVPREALEDVYAPVGIDIGSQSVPEIAVSICAELIAHRNCGGRVPGRRGRNAVASNFRGGGSSSPP
jgi:xanthine dehydrogenase accessory factor